MSFFGFLLLVVLILAGAWCYQWLRRVEEEIRSELGTGEASSDEDVTGNGSPEKNGTTVGKKVEEGAAGAGDVAGDGNGLAGAVLAAVAAEPGVKQTALYGRFPGSSKKRLQDLLRRLEKEGRLTRERAGGTYRLYRRD